MKFLYRIFKAAGTFLIALGLYAMLYSCMYDHTTDLPLTLEGTDLHTGHYYQLIGAYASPLIILPICGILGMFCLIIADRLWWRRRKTPVNLRAPYILYLRSFVADDTTAKMVDPFFSGGRAEEEEMVEVLSEIAPVVAIGNPLDKSLPRGAERIYVEDSEWKKKVEEMVVEAKLVVLRLGETGNFWWEVETCLEKCNIEKLLFIIPVSRQFKEAVELSRHLEKHGIDISVLPLSVSKPGKGSISSLLFMNRDKQIQCQNVKFPKFASCILSYQEMLRNALAGLFERFGLHCGHTLPIRKARLGFLLFFIGCMLIVPFYVKFAANDALREHYPKDLIKQCEEIPEFQAAVANFSNNRKFIEAQRLSNSGAWLLPDQALVAYFLLNAAVYAKMDSREFKLSLDDLKNTATLAKKYLSEETYQDWLKLHTQAVTAALSASPEPPIKEDDVKKELEAAEKYLASEEFAGFDEKDEQAQIIEMAKILIKLEKEDLNPGKLLKYRFAQVQQKPKEQQDQ